VLLDAGFRISLLVICHGVYDELRFRTQRNDGHWTVRA